MVSTKNHARGKRGARRRAPKAVTAKDAVVQPVQPVQQPTTPPAPTVSFPERIIAAVHLFVATVRFVFRTIGQFGVFLYLVVIHSAVALGRILEDDFRFVFVPMVCPTYQVRVGEPIKDVPVITPEGGASSWVGIKGPPSTAVSPTSAKINPTGSSVTGSSVTAGLISGVHPHRKLASEWSQPTVTPVEIALEAHVNWFTPPGDEFINDANRMRDHDWASLVKESEGADNEGEPRGSRQRIVLDDCDQQIMDALIADTTEEAVLGEAYTPTADDWNRHVTPTRPFSRMAERCKCPRDYGDEKPELCKRCVFSEVFGDTKKQHITSIISCNCVRDYGDPVVGLCKRCIQRRDTRGKTSVKLQNKISGPSAQSWRAHGPRDAPRFDAKPDAEDDDEDNSSNWWGIKGPPQYVINRK